MKYFSMFSGIGGFELGIQRAFDNSEVAGLAAVSETESVQDSTDNKSRNGRYIPTCVGYSEIDKYAIKVYERQFNGHRNYGDATAINPTDLPDFDLLVGGFPCQAFSVAGKRAGFNDTRGTLFFDIARILKEKRPRNLVLENVKGLLSHDSGKTFQTILGVLSDLGYFVEWQVLNSKDFGVPQNRERIYIVGHLGNECGRKVFPITPRTSQTLRTSDFLRINRVDRSTKSYDLGRSKISSTLTSTMWKGIDASGRTGVIEQLNQPKHSNERVYGTGGVSPTLNTMQGGNRQPFIAAQRGRGNPPKQTLEPQAEDKTNTLTAVAKDNLVVDVPRIRRLTPLECERLQGFPDDWTRLDAEGNPVSDTQRYKMCGNAVTVNVVEAVMEKLL
jgi:DNA (cytosine-5)-methyltransferase 1